MPLLVLVLLAIVASFLCFLALRMSVKRRKDKKRGAHSGDSIGFLHPHSLSGGGGERVLWCALNAVASTFPSSGLTVYAAWGSTDDAVARSHEKVKTQFGLDVSSLSFHAVDISGASKLAEPRNYPRLTLLLQALGMILLGGIAYIRHPVDVLIDTANQTFALIIPKLLGARTMSYVHYPTVSSDMLAVVQSRRAGVNNANDIASSALRTNAKVSYYRAFAQFYKLAAACTDVALANSSWTAAHLLRIWGRRVSVVFPPCKLDAAGEDAVRTDGMIVSVGQFRPEKRQKMQLEIMDYMRKQHADVRCHLVMIGGARNSEDVSRAEALRAEASSRNLPVEVRVNATRGELAAALRRGSVGLHTMRDEHFGISVAELQAAGLVVVAHGSGGVGLDIVSHGASGLLADGVAGYGDCVARALRMPEADRARLRDGARASCARFGEPAFGAAFVHALRAAVRDERR